jgi:hypothetical protein
LPNVKAGDNVYSEEVSLPHRWDHGAAQKVGDRIELFFDRVPGHPLPLMPDHPDVSCRLVVGRRAPATEEPNEPRPFVGRVDELAFYDHPLTAGETRRHFRAGNAHGPSVGPAPLKELSMSLRAVMLLLPPLRRGIGESESRGHAPEIVAREVPPLCPLPQGDVSVNLVPSAGGVADDAIDLYPFDRRMQTPA